MTIQKSTGGNLLRLTAGSMAKECCCGTTTTAVNFCDGVDCGGDPSMQVRVFDVDYAGASISWLGKTWTQSEVQAGKTECVCPVSYFQDNKTTGTGQYATHNWDWMGDQYNRLRLKRRVYQPFNYGLNQLAFGVAGYGTFFNSDFVTFQTSVTSFSSINLSFIVPPTPAAPTLNDYHITASTLSPWFGSKIHANGVEYSWDVGVGWP